MSSCIQETVTTDNDLFYLAKVDKFVSNASEMIHWCLTCDKIDKCQEKYEGVRDLDGNINRHEA